MGVRPATEWLEASGFGAHRFDVDFDLHVVAEHDATALGGAVPLHAVVETIDRRRGIEADAITALRVLLDAVEVSVEHDVLGDTTNRQRTIDLRVVALSFDLRALEGDRRERVDGEEVGRPEICVAT